MLLALREMNISKRESLSAQLSLFNDVAADPVRFEVGIIQGISYPFSQIYISEACRMFSKPGISCEYPRSPPALLNSGFVHTLAPFLILMRPKST